MSLRIRTLLVVALFGLTAGACGGGPDAAIGSGDATRHLVDEFDTLSGETIDLASLQGEDVVLWFWAPW